MGAAWLKLPGIAGQYASAPDSVALSITSDVDIRAYVAPDDWTPTSVQSLVSKWEVTGNLRSYALDLDTTGKLAFISSSGGTSGTSANTPSSVATGFTDGTGHWVRATWRNSDNRVQFFTSNDASSVTSPTWTQLGTDQSWSSTAIFDSTAKLEVGSRNTGTAQPFAGLVYRAQVRNNVLDDGTGIQFDADFTSVTVTALRTPTTFTEGSSNAATVTINGTAAWQWQTGSTNTLVLPGVAGQYASVPDSAALSFTSNLTALVRLSLVDWTPAAQSAVIAKYGAAGQISWRLIVQTAGTLTLAISTDGTNIVSATSSVAPTVSDGAAIWVLVTWRASDGLTRYFTASGATASPVASDFTQLGSDRSLVVASIFDSTQAVELGSTVTGTGMLNNASYYRAMIYDGFFTTAAFGGTKQLDTNFTGVTITGLRTPATFAESSTNAATVTLNGSAAWEWHQTVSATAVSSLGGLTATAAATPTVVAAAVSSLGRLTATAVGLPTVKATAVSSLGGLAATASALPTVAGTGAASLGGLTATASASITTPSSSVTGTAAASLGALSATAAGTPAVQATAASNLGSLTASAAATPTVTATAAAPLDALTASAAGLVTVPATAVAALGALSASASGLVTVPATAQALIGVLNATAAGFRTDFGIAVAQLGALTATAMAAVPDVNAASTSTLTGRRTSTSAVTAKRTGSGLVSASVGSTAPVTAKRTGTSLVTAPASSTSTVGDG